MAASARQAGRQAGRHRQTARGKKDYALSVGCRNASVLWEASPGYTFCYGLWHLWLLKTLPRAPWCIEVHGLIKTDCRIHNSFLIYYHHDALSVRQNASASRHTSFIASISQFDMRGVKKFGQRCLNRARSDSRISRVIFFECPGHLFRLTYMFPFCFPLT